MSEFPTINDTVCKDINKHGEWITFSSTEARLKFTNALEQWCLCVNGELSRNACFMNNPVCRFSPCDLATSTCGLVTTGYSCKCRPNFSFMNDGHCRPLSIKADCSYDYNSCMKETSDASCSKSSKNLICVCPSNMEKHYFSNLSNEMSLEATTNNFECIGNGDLLKWYCHLDFLDVSSCELTGHYCDPKTTNCVQKKSGFVCECRNGFEKLNNFFECSDIDECLQEEICSKETSVCQNTFGGYKCECLPGYANKNDHLCTVYNKCLIPKLDPCRLKYEEEKSQNGLIPSIMEKDSCIFVKFNMYQCRCAPGFIFRNLPWGCEDIDECAEGTHECTIESKCINTRGGYECECLPGFKKIAKLVPDNSPKVLCQDINECEEGVETKDKGIVEACNPHSSVCQNTRGSFKCDCFKGYLSIPNENRLFTGCPRDECCKDIDECKMNTHNCTDHCVDGFAVPNNFTCDCKRLRFLKTPFECENCQYSDYSEYGDVNTSCGAGYRNASRTPLPGYGLNVPECSKIEDTMIFQKYNKRPCHDDDYKCNLSPWSVWSTCELKLNEGSQYQTRYIISGPKDCEKVLVRYQKCQILSEPLFIDWNGIILGSLCVTLILITLAACVRRSLVRRQPRNYF
ncbi:fibrillin-1-like isoform X2 [Hylaeus volcanicus]|uniref:fibrillin-1-like isoform X2 n=1 Tax=Hylaeus volcanicus TaxID=313075 RepID=UPI0023B8168E|nr:fibrillin-1-like isoform X2 [Hylaeus volcanicus]